MSQKVKKEVKMDGVWAAKAVFYAGALSMLLAGEPIISGGGLKIGTVFPNVEQIDPVIEGFKLMVEQVIKL